MDVTTALSLLLSHRHLRELLRDDPPVLQRTLDLSAADLDFLRRLDGEDLQRQAESYLEKRFYEVVALIPSTLRRMGRRAKPLFREFAEQHWPHGHRRHLADAIAFVEAARARGVRVDVFELRRLKRIYARLAERDSHDEAPAAGTNG